MVMEQTNTIDRKKNVKRRKSSLRSSRFLYYLGVLMIVILFGLVTIANTQLFATVLFSSSSEPSLMEEFEQQLRTDFLGKDTRSSPKKRSIKRRQDDDDDDDDDNDNDNNNEHRDEDEASAAAMTVDDDDKEEAEEEQEEEEEVTTPHQPQTQIPNYYMVFSTSCEEQQDWESYVFFYHAWKVQQRGSVTRIVSGCTEAQQQRLQHFHRHHIQPRFNTPACQFHVHFTPNYSNRHSNNTYYKYMNKPYGLKHWFEHWKTTHHHHPSSVLQDPTGIVMLLDPDMILLRPLVHDFTHEHVMIVENDMDAHTTSTTSRRGTKDAADPKRHFVVSEGYPIAQQDGYLNEFWATQLNIPYVTNKFRGALPQQYCMENIHKYGPMYWNTGPPYLATVHDMYNIATLWCEYAPRVYTIHPELFAEMYAYIIATTQLNLKHRLLKSLVVSSTTSNDREGWKYIDDIPDNEICLPAHRNMPILATTTNDDDAVAANNIIKNWSMPIGLHYCKRYMVGKENFFSKYRLKKKYISCDCPLLKEPPIDLYQEEMNKIKNVVPANTNKNQPQKQHIYGYYPPPVGWYFKDNQKWPYTKKETMQPKQAKREVYMLCTLISKINEAALYWKTLNCNSDGLNKTYYDIYIDPDTN